MLSLIVNGIKAIAYIVAGAILMAIIVPVEVVREVRRRKVLALFDADKFERSVNSADDMRGYFDE